MTMQSSEYLSFLKIGHIVALSDLLRKNSASLQDPSSAVSKALAFSEVNQLVTRVLYDYPVTSVADFLRLTRLDESTALKGVRSLLWNGFRMVPEADGSVCRPGRRPANSPSPARLQDAERDRAFLTTLSLTDWQIVLGNLKPAQLRALAEIASSRKG